MTKWIYAPGVLPTALLLFSGALVQAQPAAPVAEETQTEAVLRQTIIPSLPTEMKVRDLDSSWRRYTVRDEAAILNMQRMHGGNNQWYEQIAEDLGLGVHYTRGQTMNIGQETYMVSYRMDLGMEPQDLQQEIQERMQAMWGHGERTPGTGGRIPGSATLKLALMNVRDMGSLINLRAFDAKRDLLAPADLRAISDANLQRIGQYFRQYSSWNRNLQMTDGDALRQQFVNNFHARNNLFYEPGTRELYAVNTNLNGKQFSAIGNKKAIPAVYEAAPASDNTRGVVFLDGHVERVPEWKWKAVRTRKITAPTPRDLRIISHRHLEQLHRMLQQVGRRNALRELKPGTTAAQAMSGVYGRGNASYTEPASRQPYRVNVALSGMKINDITNKSEIIGIYEPLLGSDGRRGAVYLDGKVRRVPDGFWKTAIGAKPQVKNEGTANPGT